MEGNYLESLKDKLVLVIFEEEGREKIQKGILKGVDADFVFLESYNNSYAISKKDIKKIKTAINGERENYD